MTSTDSHSGRANHEAEVLLPTLLRINVAVKENLIRQVVVPPWQGPARLHEFKKSWMRGYTVVPADGSPQILLLTNSAQPSSEWDYVLRLRGAEINPTSATRLDLTSAKWVKHPATTPALATQAEYEAQAAAALESWNDAFRYKRENLALKIDGLRPPQIGAIYAVQSHWTVNSDPATVVLPTGVGKTETMLSILVAERCKRLLVVVPTDALRTQISDKFLQLGLLKTPAFQVILDTRTIPL